MFPIKVKEIHTYNAVFLSEKDGRVINGEDVNIYLPSIPSKGDSVRIKGEVFYVNSVHFTDGSDWIQLNIEYNTTSKCSEN